MKIHIQVAVIANMTLALLTDLFLLNEINSNLTINKNFNPHFTKAKYFHCFKMTSCLKEN